LWDNNQESDNEEDDDWTTPIPSFTGFTKLKTLEISSQVLFNRRILEDLNDDTVMIDDTLGNPTALFTLAHLPVSIVNLTVHNVYPPILDHFSSLDFHVLSNLKTIRLNFADGAVLTRTKSYCGNLVKRCREHGATIVVAYNGNIGSIKWVTPETLYPPVRKGPASLLF